MKKRRRGLEEEDLEMVIVEDTEEGETDEKQEERVSVAAVISIVIFIIALVGTITMVLVVQKKSKPQPVAPQQQQTETVEGNNTPAEQANTIPDDAQINDNVLPDPVSDYSSSIQSISMNGGLSDELIPVIKNTFAHYLEKIQSTTTNYNLVIDNLTAGWYWAKCTDNDYDYWISTEKDMVIARFDDVAPDKQYTMQVTVEGKYGQGVFYSIKAQEDVFECFVYADSSTEKVIFDKESLELREVEVLWSEQ